MAKVARSLTLLLLLPSTTLSLVSVQNLDGSFVDMYPGKADEWLYLERGVGAFYYTMFQRTITTLTAMYASHDISNTACKRCCLSVIIKISSIQYFHRLLHLPCLLHVQQGRDPQVGNPLNVCVMLVKHCLSLFSLIQRTAADNLAEDSAAAWFLVFASAFW